MTKPKERRLFTIFLCLLTSGFVAGEGTRSVHRRRLVYDVESNEPIGDTKDTIKSTVTNNHLWNELDQQEDTDEWQRLLHDYDMSMDCIPYEYSKKSKSSKSQHHTKLRKRGYEYRR